MSDHKIAIITDTTCDIPPDWVKEHHIYLVNQHVIWGKEDLLDGVDITPTQFYERLPKDPVHPKTSQPVAKEFSDMVAKAQADGADQALILTISSALSGTHDSAIGSIELSNIPVKVHDSKSASMGLGWQVLAAAKARADGGDIDSMIAAAEKVKKALSVRLVVDTLDYLHKGGRIGGAARLVGTALNLKPQLFVDHTVGRIEPGERTRTRKKAVEALYSTFFETLDTSGTLRVAVLHAAAENDANAIADRIRADYKPEGVVIGNVAAVIGVHVGPGTIALAGYREN
jgi:DegV family protein with EDD domain